MGFLFERHFHHYTDNNNIHDEGILRLNSDVITIYRFQIKTTP